jgi:hypothetical protein
MEKLNKAEHLSTGDMEKTEGARKTSTAKWIYLMILVAGILLYIVWGAAFNAFFDLGLYSIVILMVLFGLCGFALYTVAPDGGKK